MITRFFVLTKFSNLLGSENRFRIHWFVAKCIHQNLQQSDLFESFSLWYAVWCTIYPFYITFLRYEDWERFPLVSSKARPDYEVFGLLNCLDGTRNGSVRPCVCNCVCERQRQTMCVCMCEWTLCCVFVLLDRVSLQCLFDLSMHSCCRQSTSLNLRPCWSGASHWFCCWPAFQIHWNTC